MDPFWPQTRKNNSWVSSFSLKVDQISKNTRWPCANWEGNLLAPLTINGHERYPLFPLCLRLLYLPEDTEGPSSTNKKPSPTVSLATNVTVPAKPRLPSPIQTLRSSHWEEPPTRSSWLDNCCPSLPGKSGHITPKAWSGKPVYELKTPGSQYGETLCPLGTTSRDHGSPSRTR
jgi:hypothetical protein